MQGVIRGSRLVALSLSLLLTAALSAVAVVVPQSIETLTRESSDIVRGTVLSQQSQWDPSHQYIYTAIKVKVAEAVKGALAPDHIIEINTLGGTVDDTSLWVEHAAAFDDGQEVLLFLNRRDAAYEVTAWEQGKVTIENGAALEKGMSLDALINQIKAAH